MRSTFFMKNGFTFAACAVAWVGTTLAMASVDPAQTAPSNSRAVFGEKISLSTPVKLEQVLKEISSFENKDILVEGKIEKVCKKKGCWMVVKDCCDQVRVTFAGYKFFVPKDSQSKNARVQGRISKKTISEKEARHYLEDENAPIEEINKIKGPQNVAIFVATGAEIFQ